MESDSSSEVTSAQTPIPIHSGEVRAALLKARELGWRCLLDGHNPVSVTEMGMEQVLQAAFEYRGGRFNQTLRQEARKLERQVTVARQELEQLGYDRRDILWAQDVRGQLIEFLELVRNTRVIRIAESYHDLRRLLEHSDSDSNPGLSPEP